MDQYDPGLTVPASACALRAGCTRDPEVNPWQSCVGIQSFWKSTNAKVLNSHRAKDNVFVSCVQSQQIVLPRTKINIVQVLVYRVMQSTLIQFNCESLQQFTHDFARWLVGTRSNSRTQHLKTFLVSSLPMNCYGLIAKQRKCQNNINEKLPSKKTQRDQSKNRYVQIIPSTAAPLALPSRETLYLQRLLGGISCNTENRPTNSMVRPTQRDAQILKVYSSVLAGSLQIFVDGTHWYPRFSSMKI